jgi:hypothetical protein
MTELVQASHTGSHSGAVADIEEVSHMRSYYFMSSTVTVSRIREMIDHSYFTEGMGCAPREETVLEPNASEAVVFDEFFTVGLRMPPHLVLSDILLKFQV